MFSTAEKNQINKAIKVLCDAIPSCGMCHNELSNNGAFCPKLDIESFVSKHTYKSNGDIFMEVFGMSIDELHHMSADEEGRWACEAYTDN